MRRAASGPAGEGWVVLVELAAVSSSGMPGPGLLVPAIVAQDPSTPGQGPEYGTASPIALVVILLLALATVLLIRSMTKRIRRLPASFGPEPERDTEHDTPDDKPEP